MSQLTRQKPYKELLLNPYTTCIVFKMEYTKDMETKKKILLYLKTISYA